MTLGTTAIPRWSQSSDPVTTGQWCLIPGVPALSPPWLLPCSQAGLTSPILSSSFFREGRRNIGKKHPVQWEARGWRRCYIPLPINIQSVGQGPEPGGAPPHALADLATTTTHGAGGTGAPSRRRLSTTCPNSHPPTQLPGPHDWHPSSPPAPPLGCE